MYIQPINRLFDVNNVPFVYYINQHCRYFDNILNYIVSLEFVKIKI